MGPLLPSPDSCTPQGGPWPRGAQPWPRYLRLRLLRLVLRLHQLFVNLLQPGRPDLWGQSGCWDPQSQG